MQMLEEANVAERTEAQREARAHGRMRRARLRGLTVLMGSILAYCMADDGTSTQIGRYFVDLGTCVIRSGERIDYARDFTTLRRPIVTL